MPLPIARTRLLRAAGTVLLAASTATALTPAVHIFPSANTGSASPTSIASTATSSAATYAFKGTQVFPEGLARDTKYLYSTSFADGTVYRGSINGKTLTPFLAAGKDGRTSSAGVRIAGDRLLVAGGMTGRFFIYTKTGSLVSSYTVPNTGEPTLVNDAAVAPNGDVYITDSFRAEIYRIPAREVQGRPTHTVKTLAVAYALPDYIAGASNGNGIAATPDGKYLLVGYYTSGDLYRITVKTGKIQKIKLPEPLTSADGILLEGHTLYVDRAAANLVATLHISADFTTATVADQRAYPGIDTPTGLVRVGHHLVVTNSQLDTLLFGDPQTSQTFTLGTLPLRR